jgi:glycosyltransferase involved in cell wall biosynthesis
VLPPQLEKIGADVLIAPDGRCSLRTTVPQCLLVSGLREMDAPLSYSKAQRWFFKWFTPKYFRKAKLIVTPSSFLRNDIINLFGTVGEKIEVIHPAMEGGETRLSFAEQERLKEKYTAGKAFFLSKGHFLSTAGLILLLKAFSLFKKRQKSEMKLVLAGSFADKTGFLRLLKTFRYRGDVILPEWQDEADKPALLASAYALVLPPDRADFQRELLEGMQMRVPVVSPRQGSLPETGEEAALYFDPVSHEEMAETMMTVYKDENLRKECITKGEEVVSKHSLEKMSAVFWDYIQKAASR